AVRQAPREAFEAARALSRTADVAGQWLYLNSLHDRTAGRGPRVVRRTPPGGVDNLPPLPPDDLEHVLACYQAVRRQHPDWLTQTLLANVSMELRRAHRDGDAVGLVREAGDDAGNVDVVGSALAASADRGDVDAVLKLFEKLERLQAGRASSLNVPTRAAADALARAMNVCAENKAHADRLRLLDAHLARPRRQNEAAGPARPRALPGPGNNNYVVHVGASARQVQIDYPPPNTYYDAGAIQLLRNAFELYKRDDLLSDLLAHLRKRLASVPEADRVYLRLGLAYLHA